MEIKPIKKQTERQKTIITVKLKGVLAHCYGCNKRFYNIDGCPYCQTSKYIAAPNP